MADTDVSIKWGDLKPVPNKPGKWQIRVTICNLTDHEIPILVADNPWRDKPEEQRMYATKLYPGEVDKTTGQYTRASMIKDAKVHGKTLTLKPKGEADSCRDIVYEYPWRPIAAYTDVYLRNPDGSVSDAPVTGGAGTTFFPILETGMLLPGGPRPTFACVLPLPYPASVESAHDGPIEVLIAKVDGVPRGMKLVGTLPPLRRRITLWPGDRRSETVVLLQQDANLEPGSCHVITVHERVVAPAKVRHWPTRRVSFVVMGPVETRLRDKKGKHQ
jgi:hypothetical protein